MTTLVWRYVTNHGWTEVPEDTPTVPHTTEHGDVVQIVEELPDETKAVPNRRKAIKESNKKS